MKLLRLLFSCTLFLLSAIILPIQAQVCDCPAFSNQVDNPYFDLGNTQFYSEFSFGVGCSSESYFVGSEGRDKCNNSSWLDDTWDNTSGNSSGSYLIVDGPVTSTQLDTNIVWADYVAIEQGVTFKIAFAVNPRLSQFVNTDLKLAIFINDNNVSGTINPSVSGGWQEYCVDYVGEYYGPAYFQIRQIGNFDDLGYDYGLDDIYFGKCLETQNCNLTANLNWEQNYQNCEVSFTNLSTSNSATTIVGYYWEFGDGSTSTEINPTHFYTDPGSFHACLTVYGVNADGKCCRDQFCTTAINHCTPDPCRANIETIYYAQYNSQNCLHQFSVSMDPNRPVIGYFWDFGDGTTGTGQYPNHSFNNSGTYYVCVTVVLQDGQKCCTETFCKKFVVNCGHHGHHGNVIPATPLQSEQEVQWKDTQLDQFRLSPNPAKENVALTFESAKTGDYHLSIFDGSGKIIKTHAGIVTTGINQYEIDIQGLAAGIYIVNLKSNNQSSSEKLIIY